MPRGRPPTVDRHEVSLVALRLFERDGFDQVTMEDVAREASVSLRTLFRVFPSKADLVWDGLDEVLAGIHVHTANLGRASVHVLVDELFSAGLSLLDDPAVAKLARRRLRLVAMSPALLNHPPLLAIQDILTTMVAASSTPKDPPPALVSRALFAAAFAAVLWWVQNQGSMTVHEAVRAALDALPRSSRTRRKKAS